MDAHDVLERIRALESVTRRKSDKSWIEVAAIPIAIALTGCVSTWLVTSAQIESAERVARSNDENASHISQSQLEVQSRTSDSQTALKALELCITYITSNDPRMRERGVSLLSLLAPDLAAKIRDSLLAQEKDPQVLNAAREVPITGWFPVVASISEQSKALSRANRINSLKPPPPYVAEVYKGALDDKGKPVFTVTLGGFLPFSEARSRAAYAQDAGIAKDAFYLSNKRPWQKVE